ncbi:MAG: DNA-binding protein WhiA [Oscillospiraceae bacterium]|nr:DNA-binding protein WhiA [Oscillospiraceae bacterium]
MASFAANVKSEICRGGVQRPCCARAEAYGVLLFANTFTPAEVRVVTESREFAARLPRLFQRAFGVKFDVLPEGEPERGKQIFRITDRSKLGRIIDQLGYEPAQMLALHVNFGILEEACCRASFLRGAFLAGGSVTDPEKRSHLELTTSHAQASREVSALLQEMGFLPRTVRRGANSVTYFKQSEHIEDFLTTVGAPACAMEVMTAKVAKEIRNGANRAYNCDMANVNKALNAAAEQLSAIEKLQGAGRIETLPDKLQQTALLRLANPEASLQELAVMSDPPVSKSCINHRIRKILEQAEGMK